MLQTDLVTQVAEAKCSEPIPLTLKTHVACNTCDATGLRWPTLSRECPCLDLGNLPCEGCDSHLADNRFGNWHKDDCECHGSRRVPDVSLEKAVMLILLERPRICFAERPVGGLTCWQPNDSMPRQYGDTLLDAACAVLLQT